jgi:hypothetical protein
MNKITLKISVLFIALFALLINVSSVSAAGWMNAGNGYFFGKPLGSSYELMLRSCSSNNSDGHIQAFPSSIFSGKDSDTMKASLLKYVTNYYNLGAGCGIKVCPPTPTPVVCSSANYNKARNAVGARFLMTELTGGKRTLTGQALVDAFAAALNDPKLVLSFSSYTYNMNSAHQIDSAGNHDVQYENATLGTFDSIIFKYNGTFITAIKALCGNLVSANSYNPWYIEPTVTVDKPNVAIGDQVTFSYNATIKVGPTSMSNAADVSYSIDTKASSVSIGSFATKSTSGNINGSKTVTFGSAGVYCSTLKVTHGGGWQSSSRVIADSTVISDPVCVTVAATAIPDICRPITGTGIFPIVPNSYPSRSNGYVSVPAFGPVPVNVTSSGVAGKTWGPYTTTQTTLPDDFNTLNTNGDVNTIYKTDAYNHVTSITTNYNTVFYGYEANVYPTYDPLLDVPTPRPPVPTYFSYGPVTTDGTAPASPDPNFLYWYSYQVYRDSTVNYSDGDARTMISGSAPQYTNTNGSSITGSTGPCFDYTLTTNSSNVGGNYEAGSSISLNNTINSSSWTAAHNSSYYSRYSTWTHSKNVNWYLTKFVISPGVALPASKAGGESTSAPCAYYAYKVCSTESQGNTVVPKGTGSVSYGFNVPDLPAGTKICFVFSILTNQSDPSHATSTLDSFPYYHSDFNPTANCLLIVKKPKVQVWSGDLSVGKILSNGGASSSIANGSQSVKSGIRYGSWIDYAIYATGNVNGIASGSALAGGRASGDCSINLLTYANAASAGTCTGSLGGNYKYGSNIKNYTSYFSATTPLPSTNLSAISSDGVYSYGSATLSLTASSDIVRSIVINAPSTDVTISSDINVATGNYTSLSQLPQVVIVAKSIKIDESVSNIDAWLLAPSGSIDTCTIAGSRPTALTVNDCNTALNVNGPVVANKLYLFRTSGSDPGDESGTPAEIFNLRADAYLWMYSRSGNDNRWRSTYVTELPPRL